MTGAAVANRRRSHIGNRASFNQILKNLFEQTATPPYSTQAEQEDCQWAIFLRSRRDSTVGRRLTESIPRVFYIYKKPFPVLSGRREKSHQPKALTPGPTGQGCAPRRLAGDGTVSHDKLDLCDNDSKKGLNEAGISGNIDYYLSVLSQNRAVSLHSYVLQLEN